MDELTQMCCVLLLPLCLCFNSEVTERKTIGREPDVTPICTNATEDIITLIVCEIRTERSGGECRLLYRYGEDFVHECDSRFTLMMENQTVFLHLTSLTPVDSGNYTCECSRNGGIDTLRLNIIVEEEAASRFTSTLIQCALIGVTTLVITITGLMFGLICKRKRDRSRSATSGLSVCETPNSFDEDDPDDPYTSLQQPASDLYQTISRSNIENICFNNQEIDGGESDQSYEDLYENV
ncbi:uncharacterized protein LOC116386138 [Anarrhichthys ocellatus]|uniref:uncharacterized protein LOC116386138 n=1 Tax=Anarrhichthys ocellatus TaxID=433405 RepID=UPI0012ED2A37|nr:uncharacterized protein LOC116386138 [Anarrhichthys ocellatus]